MNFQPSKDKTTVVNYVTKNLRQAILNGTFKEGERLIQEDWANILNVSRMPIREALRQLQSEGLVRIVPHKGAIVTPITKEDIEEIYYLRSSLEGLAVEKSLPFLTNEDKKELANILEKMESLTLTDETNDYYISLNESFHKLLRKGCPWTRVLKTVENLGISPIAPSLLVDYYKETQREHRFIYEAVERNDPAELRAAIEYHILRTKNNLISYMEHLKPSEENIMNQSKN
ncbi:GntR family transcriptional regulator [Bacillus sp. REN10]|uniref:GntR family transcriptional regulator n=1 Tax=Bacillus sp. REN10 TaxID=2782541 RepID=UPI00193BD40B|nr:GntR family transcriptional regulator [Bacillus sp. REN10]